MLDARKRLGEILVDMGFVTVEQLEQALEKRREISERKESPEDKKLIAMVSKARKARPDETRQRLGELLIDMGFVTMSQLQKALEIQRELNDFYHKSVESQRLVTLIEIAAIMNSTLNLSKLLVLIMESAKDVMDSVASSLMLLDVETNELVFSVPTGPKADVLTEVRMPSNKGIAGWAAEHGQPLLVPDVKADSRFYSQIDEKIGFETKSILCVPLRVKEKTIGVLEVINKVDGTLFSNEDLRLLTLFANQAAIAMENACLFGELQDSLQNLKQAQSQLEDWNKVLEQRVKEKTRELEEVNEELRRMDQIKSHFLNTVSHEIRTPLTSVKGYTEVLLNFPDEPIETRQKFLGIMNEESDRLIRLVNDVLDLSKIESGKIKWHLEDLSVWDVVETAVAEIYLLAKKKNQEVIVEVARDLPPVFADRDRLVQAITNLLSNAVKFSETGGKIVVRASILPSPDPKIRVEVSDSAPAIARKDQERIFEKFEQVSQNTLTDKPKGTGLGLAICKEIVQHLGGEIWVEAKEKKGNSFYFTLPVSGVKEERKGARNE